MSFEHFNSKYSKEIQLKIQSLLEVNIPIFLFGEVGTGKSYIANQILNHYDIIYKTSFTLMENDIFFEHFLQPLNRNERCGFYITDMEKVSINLQMKLLKKLQTYQSISRFVFSSNQSQDKTISALNENFYYFFSPVNISTLPLSQRREDIVIFLKIFSEKIAHTFGSKPITFSSKVIDFLLHYSYRKNISELKSIVTNLAILGKRKQINMSDLPSYLLFSQNLSKEHLEIKTGVSLKLYERAIIEKNFFTYGKNKVKTAEVLGMSTRNLYRKLKEYNIMND